VQPAEPPSGEDVGSGRGDLSAIAEEAYLYGFPMLVGYAVLYKYFLDPDSGQYKGPINQVQNEARVFTPKDTGISTPNSDTPYSMAFLDLRAEPMVLCVPEIEKKRYYDVQLVDLYSDNYGYMGSRNTGNGAGCYLVSGPDWEGEEPKGIAKSFRSETQFTLVVYRTQLFDPADMDNVKKVQAGYRIEPLSRFLGQPAPAAAPAVDWPEFEQAALTSRFPEYLDFLLQFCPPVGTAEVEKPLREKLAKIGIGAGKKTAHGDLPADAQAAIGAGVKAAFAKIAKTAESVGTEVNGWQIGSAAGSREFYDGDWALRAAAAKLGIYGNSEAEAVYPFTRHDANGIVLDGSKHGYQMTFPAGQLPPVNAFWSITMYDGRTQLLIDNPINRYLINSPMLPGLQKNPDGSLTIYVQKDSPGKDKESNWLPAPDGPMFVVMRLYWPKTEPPSVYPLGKGGLAAAGAGARPEPQRARREASRRQVPGERRTHRHALWSRSLAPGSARLGVLELPGVPAPGAEPQPVAGHAVDLFHRPPGDAGWQQSGLELQLPARALFPVRALQGGARHLRVHGRGVLWPGHRARRGFHEPIPGRRRPPGREARLHPARGGGKRAEAGAGAGGQNPVCGQGRRRAHVRQPHLSPGPGLRWTGLGSGIDALGGARPAELHGHPGRRHATVGG
jgi:hypothetical protein